MGTRCTPNATYTYTHTLYKCVLLFLPLRNTYAVCTVWSRHNVSTYAQHVCISTTNTYMMLSSPKTYSHSSSTKVEVLRSRLLLGTTPSWGSSSSPSSSLYAWCKPASWTVRALGTNMSADTCFEECFTLLGVVRCGLLYIRGRHPIWPICALESSLMPTYATKIPTYSTYIPKHNHFASYETSKYEHVHH